MGTELTFPEIEMAAKREQWAIVDAHLPRFVDDERVAWALKALRSEQNRNSRDLAATILNLSNLKLGDEAIAALMKQMSDRMEYSVVRYRIAFALFQRGVNDEEMHKLIDESRKDPEFKDVAEDLLEREFAKHPIMPKGIRRRG